MAAEKSNDFNTQELEKYINQVKSVLSSRVVLNSEGRVEEMHVLADAERQPKQVVRDIESVLMVQLGFSLDHRKISVVQVGQEDMETAKYKALDIPSRPKLTSIEIKTSDGQDEAAVGLLIAGEAFTGKAQGPGTSRNRLRLVAQATLDAVEEYLEQKTLFVLEDISPLDIGGKRAVLTAVSLLAGKGEENLVGSCYVAGDEREAAARAALAAINRRISPGKKR